MENLLCDCFKNVVSKVPIGDSKERLVCSSCNKVFYQNPKIIAGVLPLFEDKILLCKRSIEPRKNFWTIPGGFMECDETLKEAALREAYEEAGIRPKLANLHVIYDMPTIGQVYFLFLGHCASLNYDCGIETLESKWVNYADIPWDDIAFKPVEFALKKLKNIQPEPHFGIMYK